VELLQNLPRESLVKLALPIYKGGQVLPRQEPGCRRQSNQMTRDLILSQRPIPSFVFGFR
jgi:hypothetical protein